MNKKTEKCVPCKSCPICYKKLQSGEPIMKRLVIYTVLMVLALVISIIYTRYR